MNWNKVRGWFGDQHQKLMTFYREDLFAPKNRKRLLINYGISLAIIILVYIIAFSLRQRAINETFLSTSTSTIVANTGISFGSLRNKTGLVYFLQIIPIIFSAIGMVHSKNYFFSVGISLIFASGSCNVIDRVTPDHLGKFITGSTPVGHEYIAYNAVMDYWVLGSSVYNFPDVFILVGIGLVLVYSFVNGWIEGNKKIRELEAQEAAEKAAKALAAENQAAASSLDN